MNPYAPFSHIIRMEILNLEVIHCFRLIQVFYPCIFNHEYISMYIKQRISDQKFTCIYKSAFFHIEGRCFCGNELFSIDDQVDQLVCLPYVSFQNRLFFGLECICVRRNHFVPGTDLFDRSQAGCCQNGPPTPVQIKTTAAASPSMRTTSYLLIELQIQHMHHTPPVSWVITAICSFIFTFFKCSTSSFPPSARRGT